ncbi:hypothetical protein BDV41DRAFT_543084 [Aspergillus transmontanensis]|uniref:Uncharacterized protein n=1 Tax=Aspergillus transmontanensis TaxID=1034304 RepID=A0A5N6VTA0_9EURO|nr:hypothetical protein BDV41DRAFT_543084 [Aspergillus transmontanensis]
MIVKGWVAQINPNKVLYTTGQHNYRTILEQLLKVIRECSPAALEHIIDIIRERATYEEIKETCSQYCHENTEQLYPEGTYNNNYNRVRVRSLL